jgi:hypothetical protein
MSVKDSKPPRASAVSTALPAFSALALLVCALGFGAGLAGCGSGGVESTDESAVPVAPADSASAGSVSLTLNAGNASFSSVNYTIIGGQFHTTGVLDVSNSSGISGTIGGIPFGTDYVVTLNAVSTQAAPASTCDGSASFDISSTVLVPVSVHVTCKEQKVLAATPAPIPPLAPLTLGVILLALGLFQQRRLSASGTSSS